MADVETWRRVVDKLRADTASGKIVWSVERYPHRLGKPQVGNFNDSGS